MRATGQSNSIERLNNYASQVKDNNLAPISSDAAGMSSADDQTFYAYDTSFDKHLISASQQYLDQPSPTEDHRSKLNLLEKSPADVSHKNSTIKKS